MSEGGDVRPFREPCEGKSLCGKSPLWQHIHKSEVVINGTVNTTLVPNPAGGADIPPYERFTIDESGGESCEVHHCVTDPGAAPCAQFLKPFPTNTFGSSGTNVDFRLCHKSGFKAVQAKRYWNGRFGYMNKETADCPDNVEGCGDSTQKSWRSYQSSVDRTKYLQLDISSTWEGTTYDYSSGSPVGTTTTESMSMTQAIDSLSGLYSFSGLSISPNDDRNRGLANYGPALWFLSSVVSRMTVATVFGTVVYSGNSATVTDFGGRVIESVTWDIGAGTFHRLVYQWSSTPTQLVTIDESATVTNTGITYTITNNDYNTPGGNPDGVSDSTTITVTGALSSTNTDSSIYEDIISLLAYWPLDDDDLYPWRTDLKVGTGPLVSRDEFNTTGFVENWWVKDYGSPITDAFGNNLGDSGWIDHTGIVLAQDPSTGTTTVALGGPASNGDVFDGISAGNPFSFCLSTGYSMVGVLPPGVSFDSSTGALSGTCSADCSWGITVTVTGATVAATGDVKGAPLSAGYQDFFDFAYPDFNGCCFRPPDNPGFQTWSWYQQGWGMNVSTYNSNTGCHLPLNSTQWPNYFQCVNKPQGAWIFYADPGQAYYGAGCVSSDAPSGVMDGGALFAGKYAEILEMWPSQNFARPAGDDKFIFDENHVFCAVNLSGSGEGSTWTLTDTISGLAPADDTDFSGVWGGPVVGGFYNVSSYSSGTLTLGAQVYDVPSNWASKSNSDESLCFGKVRYPTYPALLGRVKVTPDVAGTTFTFETPQPAFGMDSSTHQEQVDLWDATMTSVASNITAIRVDDSTFTTTAAHLTAKYVTIHGAPSWYVNDTRPKGDYALLKWLADYRTPGEYNRLIGVVDCSSSPISQPTENAGGGDPTFPYASFGQTGACLPFLRCDPRVVCISPNGETFPNGTTYDFPDDFVADERWGSKWWGYVQSTMTDLYWQQPHRPCNVETCAKWQMDGGICADDQPLACPAFCCPGDDDYVPDESAPPSYFFAHAPLVEARVSVPDNYGLTQDESGPTPPADVQVGWLSPVGHNTGDVAYPPLPPVTIADMGQPGGASTTWDLHSAFCLSGPGCRFTSYADVPGCPPPE